MLKLPLPVLGPLPEYLLLLLLLLGAEPQGGRSESASSMLPVFLHPRL